MSLAAALLAFSQEDYDLPKDKTNPRFQSKYTSLDKMVEVVTPLLAKHGLVWITFPNGIATEPVLGYKLIHVETGDVLEDSIPLMLEGKTSAQAMGSAITYARRYALSSVLNLSADEDDDGNVAADSAPAQLKSGRPYGQRPDSGEVMSPAQKGKIKAELTKAGAKGLDIQAAIFQDVFGKPLPKGEEIVDAVKTKAQASAVIDRLLKGALPTGVSDVPDDDAPTLEQPKLDDGSDVPF